MLTNEIINHMDADELRNYVATQREILDVYGELIFAHDNLIHQWEDLYHALEHKEDVLKSLNARKGKMAIFASAMLNKYKEYLQKPADALKEDLTRFYDSEVTAKELIDEQPTVGGWISVKDRLPDEKTNPYTKDYAEVLCVLDTRFGRDVRVYKFGKGRFWSGPKEIDKYITHWMPFPELPKEG